MKAYCITLDRSNPQRAQTALRAIQSLGLECEFADGVDVQQHDLERLKDLISPRAYGELQRGRQVHEALSGLGSVGCYLAHYRLWQRCAEGNQPIAIFEDDVDFQPNAAAHFRALLAEAEAQSYDVLRLIYHPIVRGQRIGDLLETVEHGWSTAAYVLQPRAAALIVEHALPMEMHCDYYLGHIGKQHNLRHYAAVLPLHIERGLDSTIGHSQLVGVAVQCAAWVPLLTVCALALLLLLAAVASLLKA